MMTEMVLLPILWFGLLVPSPGGVGWFRRFGTRAFLPDHLVFGIQSGLLCLYLLSVLRTLLIGPTLLVSWLSGSPFLGTLHWPADGVDLGVGDISYVELLTLFELWAGERLTLEKAHPRYLRPGRPISVSAVPFGPGIDIWRSCRFIGAMMRSLCLLPGGLLGGLCLAPLVLIIAGFVILVGRSVAMDSLLGLGKVPRNLLE